MSGKRRDKKRKSARPKAESLDPRPVVLIVCEDKVTAPEYFRGLQRAFHNPRVRIIPIGGLGVPLRLVKEAKERRAEAAERASRLDDPNIAYEAVWCVFDRDEHPRVSDALENARQLGILVAYSNPNFELWLLLHFRNQPGEKPRDVVAGMLREFVPGYDKHVEIDDFLAGYSDAVRRAKKLCDEYDDKPIAERNPYTNVQDLTALITAPAPEAPEADPDAEPAE